MEKLQNYYSYVRNLHVAKDESIHELKTSLAEHKKTCEAKPGNCPYERKVQKKIEASEKLDDTDALSMTEKSHDKSRSHEQTDIQGQNVANVIEDLSNVVARAAKSLNYHVDRGDFTPNPKAISDLNGIQKQLRTMAADKTLDRWDHKYLGDLVDVSDEILSSIKNGSKTKCGMVYPHIKPYYHGNMHGISNPMTAAVVNQIKGRVNRGLAGKSLSPFCDGPSPYEGYLKKVNSACKAATDPNAWKDEADALSDQQAVNLLETTKFGKNTALVKGGYHDTFDSSDPDEPELWSGWRASKSLSHDTVRCAAVCFKDLAERFPNIPWKDNLELRCGTKPGTGGQSTHTKDHRRHTVLFNCDYSHIWSGVGLGNGAGNYGHSDNRFPFDVLRHEMGHALISGVLPNGKRMISQWHDAMSKAYGNPSTALFNFARKNLSHYAVTDKGNGPSMAECLSECFSFATSPDYKPGYLPRPVEDFIFGKMLGVKAGQ